jgi:hypothetical protein
VDGFQSLLGVDCSYLSLHLLDGAATVPEVLHQEKSSDVVDDHDYPPAGASGFT